MHLHPAECVRKTFKSCNVFRKSWQAGLIAHDSGTLHVSRLSRRKRSIGYRKYTFWAAAAASTTNTCVERTSPLVDAEAKILRKKEIQM
jgi:hypothetical protein